MIAKNIENIKGELPENVVLVAVSKTKPIEDLKIAYDTGQRVFGENKVQEMVSKSELLSKEILIGVPELNIPSSKIFTLPKL